MAGLCVVTSRKMQMKTAANAERTAAEDQVGFFVSRLTLASSRFCFLTSAALGGLLVRPRLVDLSGGGAAVLCPALALSLGHLRS